MSFFDEDDEPRSRAPRPRRAPGGDVAADTQTIRVRQAVLAIGVIVILLLLVFGVKACRNSAKENSLKDYNREVSSIAGSSQQTGAEFFRLLGEGGSDSPADLQSAISSFKTQAEQELDQAGNLDVPDDMRSAHQSLLIALEWRRDGLEYIASQIRTALGDSGEQADKAINDIAGQMQVFLASDVAYETRVRPSIKGVLDDQEIGGQDIAPSRFMPSNDWLQPDVVANQLGQQLSGGSGNTNEPTGPGLHGTNIDAVSYGETTLQPGASNQLTYAPDSTFSVKFTNGGDNDEFDVKVTVRIQGGSGDPITISDTIDRIAPKASATANLALEQSPPLGSAVTIRVRVAPVPGEEKTDNNQAEYQAIFNEG